jgi:hypothetical protein
MVLLMDEGDCLGKNVSLLQMFRNIFQIVERCSLILAGTHAVLPVLSKVFSPIPRQFYRINVKPFSRWFDTRELVRNPLPLELREDVGLESDMIHDLHEICGGDPAEAQLYCHHMYSCVEEGLAPRMSLIPQVFRRVLGEYRSNSPANVGSVLNCIERLPDKLLFKSRWLSRRNLSISENIRIETLRKELKEDRRLSPEEQLKIQSDLQAGYTTLFQMGISELPDYVRLAGAPLTAGFWKSFVEVEKGKRWIWDDDSFEETLLYFIVAAIGRAHGAHGERSDRIF